MVKKSRQIVKNLLQDNQRDFRIIPFGFVLVYIIILLFSEFYLGSYAVIGNHFRISPIPYFDDLKVLLNGIDAIREGGNPYNVIFSRGISYVNYFNYPYIWGVFSFVPFVTISNLLYIGIAMALGLFIALYFYIGKINFQAAIVYTLLLVSPAIMLGVERANCDLIIFLLLLIPQLFKKSERLLAVAILITGMLKLFPIGAIAAVLSNANNRIKTSFWLFVSVIIAFSLYLFLLKDNILMVSKKTPRPFGYLTYGLGGIPSILSREFKNYSSQILILYIVLLLSGFILFYRFAKKKFQMPLVDTGSMGVSYLMGAGIFITTCLLGYNFEYRLVFLLFTIPQILSWAGENKPVSRGLLLLTVLIVWQDFSYSVFDLALPSVYAFVCIRLFVVFLFYGHLYIFLDFLNGYYRKLSPLKVVFKKA